MSTLDKLNTIKSNLQNAEDTDFAYMNEPVKELRHYVLYVHSSLERSLEIRITNHIIQDLSLTKTERQGTHWKMKDILEEVDYAKKIKIAQKQNAIPTSLVGKLHAVNNLRIPFAHPTSYQEKLKEFEDEEKELEAYVILDSAYTAMNDLWLSEQNQD